MLLYFFGSFAACLGEVFVLQKKSAGYCADYLLYKVCHSFTNKVSVVLAKQAAVYKISNCLR
jgi:hypothetical protein